MSDLSVAHLYPKKLIQIEDFKTTEIIEVDGKHLANLYLEESGKYKLLANVHGPGSATLHDSRTEALKHVCLFYNVPVENLV